jgi:hypothetical protein
MLEIWESIIFVIGKGSKTHMGSSDALQSYAVIVRVSKTAHCLGTPIKATSTAPRPRFVVSTCP